MMVLRRAVLLVSGQWMVSQWSLVKHALHLNVTAVQGYPYHTCKDLLNSNPLLVHNSLTILIQRFTPVCTCVLTDYTWNIQRLHITTVTQLQQLMLKLLLQRGA